MLFTKKCLQLPSNCFAAQQRRNKCDPLSLSPMAGAVDGWRSALCKRLCSKLEVNMFSKKKGYWTEIYGLSHA